MEDKNKNQFHRIESYQPQQNQSGNKNSRKKPFAKADEWLKANPKKSLGFLIIFILIIGAGVLLATNAEPLETFTTPLKPSKPEKFYSSLTRSEVSKSESQRVVTGVMIENSTDARPQSGLAQAGVVFESVAEAGITRFLALYQEGQPALIGPVRSVRPQFASLVAPFDAGLAHVGGSDIPLQKLRSGQIRDLDQFFNPNSFWRATDRFAPHNVYTSMEKLDALNKSKGYTTSNFTPWLREKKAKASEQATASTLTIPVSTGAFSVSYRWDSTKKQYDRTLGGSQHKDREKGQISPEVVIAMQVAHNKIPESNGFSYPDVNTSGKAWLFQGGNVQELNWSKQDDKSMIKFTDSESKPVKLNPGQTWISLIDTGATPTWQ